MAGMSAPQHLAYRTAARTQQRQCGRADQQSHVDMRSCSATSPIRVHKPSRGGKLPQVGGRGENKRLPLTRQTA